VSFEDCFANAARARDFYRTVAGLMLPDVHGAILLLLGVVFIAAALAKLTSPEPFRATVRKLYGPRAVTPIGVGVPITELFLGAWLISGAFPHHSSAVALVLLLVFTSVLMRIWRKGLTCGCFGEASESAPAGIARNIILIALAAWIAMSPLASTVDGPWSLGTGMVLGRWTLVFGAACAWACVVQVVRRGGMKFSSSGA
jgi:uncharacterized membrane protein YphA (DoxX/SURF4 family)